MTDAIQSPLVLTGTPLLEALEFSVEGPELARGKPESMFALSAEAAEAGMRLKVFDLFNFYPPKSAIEISATWPPVARLTRQGIWYSNGAPWDWDEFVTRVAAQQEDLAKAGHTLAVLLNADDPQRDLQGVVWGTRAGIENIAADQERRALAQTVGPPGQWSRRYGYGYPRIQALGNGDSFTVSNVLKISET